MSSIRIERVAFAYSDLVPLLAEVDLHLVRGFTGIVGENGSGKSTLLGLVGGRLAPTAGRVEVEPRGALVAGCPQDIARVPSDAVALAGRDDAGAGRWRALLALDEDQLARWDTLSPGERRRWQLAGALAREPDILLLDEPTNHVDARGRAQLVAALRRFDGIALVVSHDRALLDELTIATIRVAGGGAKLYPGGYSAAKRTWEADAQRARDVRCDAQRAAAKAERQLARAREDHRGAVASTRAGRRMKSPRDHDATSIGRSIGIGWAEDRLGRRVEVARRAAEQARADVPEAPAVRELGRSVFVDYERCPRRFFDLSNRRTEGDRGRRQDRSEPRARLAQIVGRDRIDGLEVLPDDIVPCASRSFLPDRSRDRFGIQERGQRPEVGDQLEHRPYGIHGELLEAQVELFARCTRQRLDEGPAKRLRKPLDVRTLVCRQPLGDLRHRRRCWIEDRQQPGDHGYSVIVRWVEGDPHARDESRPAGHGFFLGAEAIFC